MTDREIDASIGGKTRVYYRSRRMVTAKGIVVKDNYGNFGHPGCKVCDGKGFLADKSPCSECRPS